MNSARQTLRLPPARLLGVGVMWVCFGLIGACETDRAVTPPDLTPVIRPVQAPLPSYEEVVSRHNARVAPLGRLWASSDVKVRWIDEKGRYRSEEGGGNLILVRPRRVALTVSKLGQTGLWAGSNEERYFLFDAHERDAAWVGRHENAGLPCSKPLPLPVPPEAVGYLWGVMPLPIESGTVERVEGYLLLEPAGLNVRMLLHPDTLLPVRVDLTDPRGYSVLTCRLSEYAPVELADLPEADRPRAARVIDCYPLTDGGEQTRLTLELSNLSDGTRGNKINDRVFDFDTVKRVLKPRTIIDLDAACGGDRP